MQRAQASAQRMYELIFDMKFLPPGRGLWAMGTAITEERQLYAALNNCAFVSTGDSVGIVDGNQPGNNSSNSSSSNSSNASKNTAEIFKAAHMLAGVPPHKLTTASGIVRRPKTWPTQKDKKLNVCWVNTMTKLQSRTAKTIAVLGHT